MIQWLIQLLKNDLTQIFNWDFSLQKNMIILKVLYGIRRHTLLFRRSTQTLSWDFSFEKKKDNLKSTIWDSKAYIIVYMGCPSQVLSWLILNCTFITLKLSQFGLNPNRNALPFSFIVWIVVWSVKKKEPRMGGTS